MSRTATKPISVSYDLRQTGGIGGVAPPFHLRDVWEGKDLGVVHDNVINGEAGWARAGGPGTAVSTTRLTALVVFLYFAFFVFHAATVPEHGVVLYVLTPA